MSEKQFNKWRAKNNPIKESRAENLKQLASMEMPYRVNDDGDEFYKTKDGVRVEYISGTKIWRDSGWTRHRLDGPAVEITNGDRFWYVNGKQHRLDGPAAEYADGSKEWWFNNKLHRTDGPAIEQPNGTKAWYVNGERHRLDGPAIEHAGGHKEWFVNDAQLSKEQFNRRAKNNLSR